LLGCSSDFASTFAKATADKSEDRTPDPRLRLARAGKETGSPPTTCGDLRYASTGSNSKFVASLDSARDRLISQKTVPKSGSNSGRTVRMVY